ncbi:MAG: PKD domain-containing protein, partial [Bacteroidota bacterium]
MKLQNILLVISLLFFSVSLGAQTCSDGVQNGTETGIDCGGSCPEDPNEACLTDDAYIRSNGSNNDGATMNVDASNGENAYLKFKIPSGTINSVRLELKSQNPSVTDIKIYKSNNTTWSESTVNNGSRPAMDTELTILTASVVGANTARWDLKKCDFSSGETVTLILTRNSGALKTVFLSKEQGGGLNRPKLFINQSTDNSNCGGGGNNPPTAGFTYTVSGSTVTFDNTSTDPDSDPLTYMWDFDDGNTDTDEDPIHTYSSDGMYMVSLTANDGTTTNTYTETIDISTGGSGGGNSPWITGANDAIYYSAGNVGIGVAAPNDKLVVAGTIRGQRVRILSETDLNFPDYVFAPEYELLSLEAVEKYI